MTPEDSSVSEVGSHKTTRTRSSCTSRERSSNAKLKTATKRASLIAEESLLEEKYRLKKIELDLNKEKKALQLRTEIAKAEAEERAYIGFTSLNQMKDERRTGFVTPPGPTRPNLQAWNERARSSLHLLGDRVRSSLQVSRYRHPLMRRFITEPVIHRGSNNVEPVRTKPV